MKIKLKSFPLFLLLLLASFLTLLFAVPDAIKNKFTGAAYAAKSSVPVVPPAVPLMVKSAYDSLHLNTSGLTKEVYEYAMKGVAKLTETGQLNNQSIVTIIDFSQPSYNKRLYIVDIKNYKILFNTWVAHGRNSGREWARSFSNTLSSLKSSPGFYITGDTYIGGNGYSLKLNGMEKGINDHANERAIVMHGAAYVSQAFIHNLGYIGRSYGCPAVAANEASPIINTIKNGTCLFIYPPDKSYTQRSRLLG